MAILYVYTLTWMFLESKTTCSIALEIGLILAHIVVQDEDIIDDIVKLNIW